LRACGRRGTRCQPAALDPRPRRKARQGGRGTSWLHGSGLVKSRLRNVPAMRRPRVLIIVQNLPVPFDRRVWLECRAPADGGYAVAVVCPKGPGDPPYAVLDGVTLYKYEQHEAKGGMLDFLVEYAYSLAVTTGLSIRAWHRGRFDIVQACNPPDIF